MRVKLWHDHQLRSGPLHRLPAAIKLGVGLGLVVTTVLLPASRPLGFAVIGALLLAAALVSRIAMAALLRRLLLLEPFVLGIVVLTLFQPDGFRVFGTILLKTNLCLLATILLSATTPFAGILRVLRQLHVPGLMISTLTLMQRYLFLLTDEAERMRRARAARTFARRPHFHWKALATVIGQLFIRASERAERIYDAMCARGWK